MDKIYRPPGYSMTTQYLIDVFRDFENNYLSGKKEEVTKALVLVELKLLLKNDEFLEKIKNVQTFLEYSTKLFAKSIRPLSNRDEVIKELKEKAAPETGALFLNLEKFLE